MQQLISHGFFMLLNFYGVEILGHYVEQTLVQSSLTSLNEVPSLVFSWCLTQQCPKDSCLCVKMLWLYFGFIN